MSALHRRLVVALVALLAVVAAPRPARAQLSLRGNYWRDRNTRVIAPEADFSKELPSGTIVSGGYLLDTITSASASAGVSADQPFTELRNQISLAVGQRIGPATVTASYRYSTESDYWAHVGGVTVGADLFQKNLTLRSSFFYSHSDVGRRVGASGFTRVGHLDSRFFMLSAAQVLGRELVGEATYELAVEGDDNDPLHPSTDPSFQANPYRTVLLGGTPTLELEPGRRVRHSFTGTLRYAHLFSGWLRYLGAAARYRYYLDDWGVDAHAPELRTYVGLGPVEVRVTGRWYHQSRATFYNEEGGVAAYNGARVARGIQFKDCSCYTGDSKLSTFSSVFFELRLQLGLGFLDSPSLPLGRWLGAGVAAVSYGHYVNDRFAHIQYGDAEVAGLEIILPL